MKTNKSDKPIESISSFEMDALKRQAKIRRMTKSGGRYDGLGLPKFFRDPVKTKTTKKTCVKGRKMYFRRNNSPSSPKNGKAIVTLWVCPESLTGIDGYGSVLWKTNGYTPSQEGYTIVDVEDILEKLTEIFPDYTDCFNPRSIVESAGFWDDWDLVVEAWEKVLDPLKIGGIRTYDGLILVSDLTFLCEVAE